MTTTIRHHFAPFAFAVLDDFAGPAELAALNDAWPAADWPGWHHYSDPLHAKDASDRVTPIPPVLSIVLARVAAVRADWFDDAPGAVPDLSLHGAGLHEMRPGSRVGRHRDAQQHPRLGLARALSAALYVHERWEVQWGGELVLGGGEAVLEPLPGRLVVFDCRGEDAWHEVREVRCPLGASRRSLCCFFYLPVAGDGLTRALFAPPIGPVGLCAGRPSAVRMGEEP